MLGELVPSIPMGESWIPGSRRISEKRISEKRISEKKSLGCIKDRFVLRSISMAYETLSLGRRETYI